MKKLQNDLTIEEQVKRLLELGVPADSANFYYFEGGSGIPNYIHEGVFSDWKRVYDMIGDSVIIPCWSAGRLIEIFELCSGVLWQDTAQPSVKQPTLIERVIDTIVLFNKHGNMDFSKLEEEK